MSQEYANLPRWARVAFAARCARRAQPVFRFVLGAIPMEHGDSIEDAISIVEQAAKKGRMPEADPTLLLKKVGAAVEVLGGFDLPGYKNIDDMTLAECAKFAARSAYCALEVLITNDTNSTAGASLFCAFACSYSEATASGGLKRSAFRETKRDHRLLLTAAANRGWNDNTPVSEDFFGPFWPDNPPGEREGRGA